MNELDLLRLILNGNGYRCHTIGFPFGGSPPMDRRSLFALAFASFGPTFALTLAITPARADETNLTGTWKSTFTIPNGKSIEIIYKLKQEGGKLTGTATAPADGSTEGRSAEIKDGEVKDGKVTFTVVRERNGKTLMTSKYQGAPEQPPLAITFFCS
jgi:hypothetical protein